MSGLQIILVLVLMAPQRVDGDICEQANDALRRKDLVAAESLLKQCIKAQPGAITPYVQFCALYQSQGRQEDLYQIARTGLGKFPGEKRFYVTVGLHDARSKQYESAIEVFMKGVRRWPDDPKLRGYLSSAYLEMGLELLDAGKDAESTKVLRKAIKLEPNDVEAHLNLGRALQNQRLSPEAVAEFDRVLQLKPDMPLAHFHRGVVLHSMWEFKRAISDLDQEIALNPAYPPSYLFRGQAKMGLEEWSDALPDLEIGVLRMPENFKAQYSLGRCLATLGRTADAEMAFRKAIALNPTDTSALMALGRLLQRSGRSDEADLLFKKAAEMLHQHQRDDQDRISKGAKP